MENISPNRSPRIHFTKLVDVCISTPPSDKVNVEVTAVYTRDFNSPTNSGKVSNVTIMDESGTLRLVVWNTDIEKYNFMVGDKLSITNFGVRAVKPEFQVKFGMIELHIKPRSVVSFLSRGEKPMTIIDSISSVLDKSVGALVAIEGTVISVSDVQDVGKDGQYKKVDIVLKDITGNVKVVFWGNVALNLQMKVGQQIKITHGVIKEYQFVNYVSMCGSSTYRLVD